MDTSLGTSDLYIINTRLGCYSWWLRNVKKLLYLYWVDYTLLHSKQSLCFFSKTLPTFFPCTFIYKAGRSRYPLTTVLILTTYFNNRVWTASTNYISTANHADPEHQELAKKETEKFTYLNKRPIIHSCAKMQVARTPTAHR